jgi:hypothetical protein
MYNIVIICIIMYHHSLISDHFFQPEQVYHPWPSVTGRSSKLCRMGLQAAALRGFP